MRTVRHRHACHGQGLGEERRTHVAIHCFARGCRSRSIFANTSVNWSAKWNATSTQSWSGSRSITTTPTMRMFICSFVECAKTAGHWRSTASICAQGLRIRSQEIATRELGPRLEPEILRSRERAVRREQWTEIDRALQRKADGERPRQRMTSSSRAARELRIGAEQEIDRLQFLSGLGLARRVDERSWQLSAGS